MTKIDKTITHTDWQLLSEQKMTLIKLLNADLPDGLFSETVGSHLNGLLNFIDAIQDAAHDDGHAVVFLTEDLMGE
jgi:hypothetical protein